MSIGGYATQPSFKNPGYIPNNDGEAVIYPGMFGVVNILKLVIMPLVGQVITLNQVFQ